MHQIDLGFLSAIFFPQTRTYLLWPGIVETIFLRHLPGISSSMKGAHDLLISFKLLLGLYFLLLLLSCYYVQTDFNETGTSNFQLLLEYGTCWHLQCPRACSFAFYGEKPSFLWGSFLQRPVRRWYFKFSGCKVVNHCGWHPTILLSSSCPFSLRTWIYEKWDEICWQRTIFVVSSCCCLLITSAKTELHCNSTWNCHFVTRPYSIICIRAIIRLFLVYL